MACLRPNKVILSKIAAKPTFLGPVYSSGVGKDKLHYLPGVYDEQTGLVVKNVPCGKCLACRMEYSKMWATRCVLESQCYDKDKSWFLTLTYDDADEGYQNECRADNGFYSLRPAHMTEFIKRLRERMRERGWSANLRYFYCGEYGDKTNRPHYHMLLFNCALDDLTFYSRNFRGDMLFNSQQVSEAWSHGFAVVGELSYETCAYTARYVTKKAKDYFTREEVKRLEADGIVPEFVRMSRNPGIGVPFFEAHSEEILEDGRLYLPTGKAATVRAEIPRLFMDKLASLHQVNKWKSYDQQFSDFLAKREDMWKVQNLQYLRQLPSFNEREYFRPQEKALESRLKALQRTL